MEAILKSIGILGLGVAAFSFSLLSYADEHMPSPFKWYCPEAKQLHYTKAHNWVKQPYWRSYGSSLSSSLVTFLGAEWQGTSLGEIGQFMCLYAGENTDNFPVVMHFHSLVYLPRQRDKLVNQSSDKASSKVKVPAKHNAFKYWHKAPSTAASGGYLVMNCESKNHAPQDCPFYPRVAKPQGDIYKEAENIKENAEPRD